MNSTDRISTNTNILSFLPDGSKIKMKDILPRIAAAGFVNIDLNFCEMMNPYHDIDREYINTLKDIREELGIRYVQSHLPYYGHEKEIMLSMEYCQELGITDMVIHPINNSIDDNHEYFSKLVPYVDDGNYLCIENMENINELHELRDLDRLAKSLPRCGVCLDTSHANMMEQLNFECISEIRDTIRCTHISDNHGIKDEHLLPGCGSIDWNMFTDSLKRIDYQGRLNYEIMFYMRNIGEDRRDEEARRAFSILRRMSSAF